LHLPAATKLPPLGPGKCCAVVSRHTICVHTSQVVPSECHLPTAISRSLGGVWTTNPNLVWTCHPTAAGEPGEDGIGGGTLCISCTGTRDTPMTGSRAHLARQAAFLQALRFEVVEELALVRLLFVVVHANVEDTHVCGPHLAYARPCANTPGATQPKPCGGCCGREVFSWVWHPQTAGDWSAAAPPV